MMADEIFIQPIGIVRSPEMGEREDGWGDVHSEIVLDRSRFAESALDGLEAFSHVEVLFQFHRVAEKDEVFGTRHPRSNINWPKVGILAQRGKDRPNRIGATICRVIRRDAFTLYVKGLDAYDGSPVLDIKPVFREFVPSREEIHQPQWANELMKEYF